MCVAAEEADELSGEELRTEITIGEAVEIAIHYIENQKLAEAEEILRHVVLNVPDHAEALNYLGIIAFHLHGASQAAEHLSKASEICPRDANIRNNFGNALVETRRFEEAEAAYRLASELDPDLGDPYCNLATIVRKRGESALAEKLLRKAVEVSPRNGYAYHNLGVLLISLGRPTEAIPMLWRAKALIPRKTLSAPFLAVAYWNAGMVEDAKRFVRRWAENSPDDTQAQHLCAAMTGENVPERASENYVANLFDGFASSFDSRLDDLEYRAPELVGAVATELAAGRSDLDIVDAGAGTGKCGRYLRPLAQLLLGVDLSKGMLAEAKKLGLYDHLFTGELTQFLNEHDDVADIVVSADTLCYFGVLEEFSIAARKALRPGGHLIFTVEALLDDEGGTFVLRHHGRYAHSRSYLRQVLENAGFAIDRIVEERLRMEGGKPVQGYLVAATAR